jgi:hypothetical protein
VGLLDKPLPVSEAAVDNAIDAIIEQTGPPVGLRPEVLRAAVEAAIHTVLADDHTALRLAVHRCRLAANAMPWKSWGEVPRGVRDAYLASARKDLAAVRGPNPNEESPEETGDPQTKMEDIS